MTKGTPGAKPQGCSKLLFSRGGAVDVAGPAPRIAGEPEDGGLIDETLGDGHGLNRRRQELPSFPEGEIGHHDGEAPAMTSADEAEEFVGRLTAHVCVKASIVQDQEIRLRDSPEGLATGAVGLYDLR